MNETNAEILTCNKKNIWSMEWKIMKAKQKAKRKSIVDDPSVIIIP